jgi:hypothetical protein
VIGHSFGGICSIYLADKDKRIKGVCISLDPPTFGLPDEYTKENILIKDLNDKNKEK